MKNVAVLAALCLASLCAPARAQSYTFSSVSKSIYYPGGVAIDSSGNIYATAYYSGRVVKLSPSGSILAEFGTGRAPGADGTAATAGFYFPRGLALDAAGNLYVADTTDHAIRKISPTGDVTTLAGSLGVSGNADGIGAAARFRYPQGVAVDSAGNIFVTDSDNNIIRKITPAGVVTTLAGSPGVIGAIDGTGSDARFANPQGLAIDSVGNLYVADTGNSAIRKVTPAGVVTTFAGLLLSAGSNDGTGAFARFSYPEAITIDSAGNLYVADTRNCTVRKISSAGVVTTVGGLAGTYSGDVDGTGSTARFNAPRGIAVDSAGNLYVADSAIKLGTPSSQLAITIQPQALTVASGSTAIFSVTATGGAPLSYQWQKNGAAIASATSATYAIASPQASDAATYSVVVANSISTLASNGAALTVLSASLANDNFANAQVISGSTGTTTGNNNGATGEPGEPEHYTVYATPSSVWFKWTPTQTGTATFDFSMTGQTAAGAAYTGTSLTTLVRLAANASGYLSFPATSGATYYIALGTAYDSTARGNFTLSWRTLLNDNFANAQLLAGNSGSVSGNNYSATGEPGEPVHFSTSGTHTSVWYRWIPTQSGTAIFDTAGSNFNTVLAAYTGNSVSPLTQLAQDDSPNPNSLTYGARSKIVFNVTAGVTYSIAVGTDGSYYNGGNIVLNWQVSTLPVFIVQPSFVVGNNPPVPASIAVPSGTAVRLLFSVATSTPITFQWARNGTAIAGATSGTYDIASAQSADAGDYTVTITNVSGSITSRAATLRVLVTPTNDNFANAVALPGFTGSITGTNVNATGETGEPVHWNFSGTASSVWYKWIAPASGLVAVDTVGSNFDTVLAVYSGSVLTSLTRLIQDDDRGGGRTSLVNFAATSGTTYYIAIGGATSSARGNITLNWQLSPVLAVATPPASQTVAVGGSATFSVTATGAGVTYQWNRNGTAIPDATQPMLTVGNIQGGADASYTVTITNSTGSITSAPATLSVAAPALTTLTIRNASVGGGLLWSIAAGGSTLVAVGDGGVIISSTDNGHTWSPRVSGTTNWIVGVTYGAGQFVAVADRGLILLSPDGATWTPASSSGTAQRMNNVIYADGKFVAVGEGGTILTSIDANTWTPRVSGTTSWLHGLAYNASIKSFATSGQGGVFLYSSDGATWNQLPITGLTTDLEATVAVDSYAHFVSIGQDGVEVSVRQNQVILKTGDTLTTWSGTTNATGSSVRFRGLAQGASALFATGEGGKVVTATSDTGPYFTLPSGTTANLLAGIYYNNSLFLVGENETVIQSDPLFASRLINISTRGQVGTDANIMISGFVVTGTQPKPVLVRAAGPTLASAFDLPGTLDAPVLKVIDAQGVTIGTNTGWTTATNATAISTTASRVGAFPFGAASADSAVLVTLQPGPYTAQVSGANNGTGLAIVEAYDTDPLSNDTSRAINISTRGVVGTGANKLIAGFVIDGASSRRVLIRAVGPGLAGFGLTGTLAEPQLELYNGKGLLHSSAAAWGVQPNADEIRGAIEAAGAFKLTDGSKDSAMVVTLLPGAWTVQVSGASSGTGLALIEVYALP
jgi:hypothetical protein